MVIADLFLKGQDGISTLKEIRKFDPSIIVVLLTSNGHVSSATEAIRFGAFDYLQTCEGQISWLPLTSLQKR